MNKVIEVVNDSGELISRVQSTFSDSYDGEKNEYRVPSHRRGFRSYRGDYPIRDGDLGKMVRLSHYLIVGNAIGKKCKTGYRYGTMKDIGGFIGISERSARNFVARMKRKRIIVKQGNAYIVNPAFFVRTGQRITGNMYKLFKDELSEFIPGWVKKEFEMRG